MIPGLTFRAFNTDDLEELGELIRRAYAQLASGGLTFAESRLSVPALRERLDVPGCECVVAEYSMSIVGLYRLVFPAPLARPAPAAWFQRNDVALLDTLAVQPDVQGIGVGTELFAHAQDQAIEQGADEIALGLPMGAGELIETFKRRGYRLVDKFDHKGVKCVVLSKALDKDAQQAA